MTTIEQAETGVTPEMTEAASRAIAEAKERAWSWGKLSQFLIENPDMVASGGDVWDGYINVYLPDNVMERLADVTRRALKAGARVEKDYGDRYGGVRVYFGSVYLHVYSVREQVCERVVVGTREVVEEVQDPEALAAVPTITQTRVEEIVEWQCRPLLADEQAGQVPA